MKLVSGSLLVALVSTTAWAAAPDAAPVAGVPSMEAGVAALPVPTAERLALAKQFVGLALPEQKAADEFRMATLEAARSYATAFYDEGDDREINEAMYGALHKLEPTIYSQVPQLRDAYAAAYAREYSADELKTMVAFAGTPAGKHFLSQAGVPEDWGVVAARQRFMNSIVPTLQDMAKDACAKRAAIRVAAGDAKAKCPLAGKPGAQAG